MMANPYQRYRQIQIETASPIGLIIMLYEGAIRYINLAKKELEEKDFESANKSMQHAQAIINELNYDLDMEAGEIATNLRNLYSYVNRTLIQANVRKDGRNLDALVKILGSLRDAWTTIDHKTKAVAGE